MGCSLAPLFSRNSLPSDESADPVTGRPVVPVPLTSALITSLRPPLKPLFFPSAACRTMRSTPASERLLPVI